MRRPHLVGSAAAKTTLTVGLALAAACASMIQREDLVGLTAGTPSAESCAECHVDVHREWAASAHAAAFTDPAFQRATLGAQTDSCIPCHVPASVLRAGGEPAARTDALAEGVTCVVCHLDADAHAMAGPLTGLGPLVPHATLEGDPRFLSSQLCGICHRGTLEQTQAGALRVGDGRTCQECHMPAVERRTTQATDALSAGIVALHDTHPSRSHTFEIDVMASFPAALSVRMISARRAEIINRLPHAIPTGDFGHRAVTLCATLLDAEGNPLAALSRRFTRQAGEAMPPGEPILLEFALPPREPRELAVTLTREGSAGEGTCVIASLRVPVSSSTMESAHD